MNVNDDHRLCHPDGVPVEFVESPNTDEGNTPEYVILHYTANATTGPAVQTLTDPRPDNPIARVSAHLVIGPDGSVIQLVPFDRIAWHAGESNWEGKRWLNRFSIGIEMVNDGKLKPGPENLTWRGASGTIYREQDVIVAVHPKEFFAVAARGDDGIMVASAEAVGGSFQPGRPQLLFSGDYRGGTGGLVAGGLTLADYAVTPDGDRFVMFPATVEDSIGVTLVTLETGWFERLRQATSVANR